MAGRLRLDWSDDSAAHSKTGLSKNPAGPNKLATAVINSDNPKVGKALNIYGSQTSCPDGGNNSSGYRCPLLEHGCYAEHGPVSWTTKRLNKQAAAIGATHQDVTDDMVEALNNSYKEWSKKKINNFVRMHVVGDCTTAKQAKQVSEALKQYVTSSRGVKNIWNYTHAWRDVPRSAWLSEMSVLASCDSLEDLPKAHAKGYATAMVMTKKDMEILGGQQNKEFGKEFMLPNGFRAKPCQYEIADIVGSKGKQCVDCKWCMLDDTYRQSKTVIVFAAHTKGANEVADELINIDVAELPEVSENPCHSGSRGHGSLQNPVRDLLARWESKGGKHWVEVYSDSHGQTYSSNDGGGNLGDVGDDTAIEMVEKRVLRGDFLPDRAKTPMVMTYHKGSPVRYSGHTFDMKNPKYDRSPEAAKWMHVAKTSNSLKQLHAAWEWAGQNNIGGDVWVSGHADGIISTIGRRLRAKGKTFTDLMRFEKSTSRRNPEDTAAEMYETFHGKPSEEILEVGETVHFHGNLAVLGELVEMKLATVTKKDVEVSFADSGVMLCSSEDGGQLYVVGGDQSLDLEKMGFTGDKLAKDMITLGVLYEVTYQTKKGFDKFRLTDYYHELGEETGCQPVAIYDKLNDFILISGGEYKIKAEGIVN